MNNNEQGIQFRNAKNYKAAIDSFIPLAEQGHVKAQHNLAMAFWHTGDEQQAYQWLKRAADVGFKPSINNIKNMNLMYALLPDEMISEIASHLTTSELCIFNQLSKHTYVITENLITSTNYLTSTRPCAQYIKSLLADIKFEPQPEAIHLARSFFVNQSKVKIHFRDYQHLQDIAKRMELSATNVYYVHDPKINNGQEFKVDDSSQIKKSYSINIVGKNRMTIKKSFSMVTSTKQKSSLPLRVPSYSILSSTILNDWGSPIIADDDTFVNRTLKLAEFIQKTTDKKLIRDRTNEIKNLLSERIKSRQAHPKLYPGLKELMPSLDLLSASNIDIEQTDYVSSDNLFFYIENSYDQMIQLQSAFSDCNLAIALIDPESNCCGIFSEQPLKILKGFRISTKSRLISIGDKYLRNYILYFQAIGGWRHFKDLKDVPIYASADQPSPEDIRKQLLEYLISRR